MVYCDTVWLIDDNEISNHLSALLLRLNQFSSNTRSFVSGQEALAELKASAEKDMFPDFIFLDLNMPVVDGWAFLEAYREFPKEIRGRCTLYMLSSSVDEGDINKSKLYEDVRDFLTKPLSKMDLEVIKFQTALLHNKS